MSVKRIYVEKKPAYAVQAQNLKSEIETFLGITAVTGVRILIRYDMEHISHATYEAAKGLIFSEPPVDDLYEDTFPHAEGVAVFSVEYLPGQFDQRADSAEQCVKMLAEEENPIIRSATTYVIEGEISEDDIRAIQSLCVNPVDSRLSDGGVPETLEMVYEEPADVKIFDGFCEADETALKELYDSLNLAMTFRDFRFIQDYFANEEKRDPSMTEIRVLDTYWSDHCRHTTFSTELVDVSFTDGEYKEAMMETYEQYLADRAEIFAGRKDKFVCLMDLALLAMRRLKKEGKLADQEESDEINACSIVVPVKIDGVEEEWLINFKNETHNHPTEIEPFGGAATCLGGCIRDPLSGRAYVYQAMRVTGAADPTTPVAETLEGKLPQRKIVTEAARGYSSYGNQIGLATGQVDEIYHPGYVAKRMEVGAVVAATPADHVRRETPAPGDKIILLGGRTGRDGIGGATGSSKAHNVESLELDGAEVQKGNAPVERKLQRLFRRGDACRLIKRCNDFGAGGVSVAVGELADGLFVDLNTVPKKYEGLDGTELAISESQERMAVDVAAEDVDEFLAYAREENLEATVIATVTEDPRMVMTWNGDKIVNLSREFLASNGASKHQTVHVEEQQSYETPWGEGTLAERMNKLVTDINVASNKGLSERFDSTIGAGTVLMPFGGKRQLTPNMAMVAKLPVFGETTTASAMAWGFNPYIMSKNQFTGAYLSVVESLAKLVAAGFEHEKAYLSFQEYFEKLRDEPERWGKPAAAVLGALMAQVDLGAGAIGGKDSMSGSFEDLDVPPTLISFAVAVGNMKRATSPEFKDADHRIVRIAPRYLADGLTPDKDALLEVFSVIEELTDFHDALAVSTPGYGATAEALFKMTLGNRIGVTLNNSIAVDDLFTPAYGSFIVELADDAKLPAVSNLVEIGEIGTTTSEYVFKAAGETLDLDAVQEAWESGIESVFPYRSKGEDKGATVETIDFHAPKKTVYVGSSVAKPHVVIPVFPGNNCEYDSAAAFERAGADVTTLIVNNLTPAAVAESTQALVDEINKSQIVMIPGGFSGGDEPDGSAKFITAFFRAPAVTEAVRDLLKNRDGLMLGICNGFQALVKLGLVPYGDIVPMTDACPTLTFNTIGRHQSRLVRTRVASDLSPWLSKTSVGDIHTVAISHGEGRFVASDEVLAQLRANGQIATQYVDETGTPGMDLDVNPNGSLLAIEGITSPDGRVFGKMGHSERSGNGLYVNVPGNKYQPIFEAGVEYFTA